MDPSHAIWIFLVGAAMVLTGIVDGFARRCRVPGIVVYVALGVLLGAVDAHRAVLGDTGRSAFGLLADIGLVVLLFRVGLESNLKGLLAKLRPAALVWTGDVLVSGLAGFLAARFGLGLGVEASAIIATALTATSIGVATSAWQAAGVLDSPHGRLMLDVAELDDISGVVLMAMLFALLPLLRGEQGDPIPLVAQTMTQFALKFAVFAGLCFLFARYAEGPLTRFAGRLEPAPQRMLSVAGMGFIIAALAGWLGFSLAIGALFAGLLFSRDPQAVKTEARFTDLYTFFAPFFFIGIGLQVELSALDGMVVPGTVLLVAAIVGKLFGAALPARLVAGSTGALLIGVSMVPRAEIALVIAQQGRSTGVLPESVYATFVLVCAATCLLAPWVLAERLPHRPTGRRGRMHPS